MNQKAKMANDRSRLRIRLCRNVGSKFACREIWTLWYYKNNSKRQNGNVYETFLFWDFGHFNLAACYKYCNYECFTWTTATAKVLSTVFLAAKTFIAWAIELATWTFSAHVISIFPTCCARRNFFCVSFELSPESCFSSKISFSNRLSAPSGKNVRVLKHNFDTLLYNHL